MYNKNQEYWLTCPRCGNKLQLMLHSTKVENLPLHCRKCKLDIIVNIGDEILVKVIEIDSQNRINLTHKGVTMEDLEKFNSTLD